MAVGLAAAVANSLLDALVNQTNYTAPTAIWIQLHTGDPGASGTANVAQVGGSTTRKNVTAAFAAAASGAVTNDVEVAWSTAEVDVSEDYTHYSIHSASTAGTFYWSGLVTANPVVVGDQFKILVGDFDLSFPVAA